MFVPSSQKGVVANRVSFVLGKNPATEDPTSGQEEWGGFFFLSFFFWISYLHVILFLSQKDESEKAAGRF